MYSASIVHSDSEPHTALLKHSCPTVWPACVLSGSIDTRRNSTTPLQSTRSQR